VSIIGFSAFIAIYGRAAVGHVDDLTQWDGKKIALLAATATLGVCVQAVVLIVPLWRSGFRWHLRFGIHDIGLRAAGRVALWTFGAVVLEQFGAWFTTKYFTSNAPGAALRQIFGAYTQDVGTLGQVQGLVVGAPDTFTIAGNAVYTQALMIYLLPHSLVTVSIGTALFTGMSSAAHAGNIDQVRSDLSRGVRTVSIFTIFATGVFVVLAAPITKVLVPTVGATAGAEIGRVLIAMGVGLVPLGSMVLMKWVFYAYEDGATVFVIQVVATIALVSIAWVATRLLAPQWWVAGVGLAISLSNLVAVIGRTAGLRRKLGGLDGYRIIQLHVRAIAATAGSVGIGWLGMRFFGDVYGLAWYRAGLVTAVVGIMMTTTYVVLLKVLRVTELSDFVQPFARRLRRR
jgi:putative peptidoglycan lipid II flippase